MSGEVTFKTQAPAVESAPQEFKSGTDSLVSSSSVEVPYLDYEREHGKPFSVEYFGLGESWREAVGGFSKEIGALEGYFSDLISRGEIANSTNAVKDRLKEILRVTNMSKEERAVVKLETIAAYIKFLMEKEDIKHSVTRYGSTK